SSTTTSTPDRARKDATAAPAGPAPTTTAPASHRMPLVADARERLTGQHQLIAVEEELQRDLPLLGRDKLDDERRVLHPPPRGRHRHIGDTERVVGGPDRPHRGPRTFELPRGLGGMQKPELVGEDQRVAPRADELFGGRGGGTIDLGLT